jgi:hypothetical protein
MMKICGVETEGPKKCKEWIGQKNEFSVLRIKRR